MNSVFYHTETLKEIEQEMAFDEISIPDDDFELGNIPGLLRIPFYSDTSPEEDEYVDVEFRLASHPAFHGARRCTCIGKRGPIKRSLR